MHPDYTKADRLSGEVIGAAIEVQLLSYMRLMNVPIGLLINFNEPVLKNGIHRIILKGASS